MIDTTVHRATARFKRYARRAKSEQQGWQEEHELFRDAAWPLEDSIKVANRLFAALDKLTDRFQLLIYKQRLADVNVSDHSTPAFTAWLDLAKSLRDDAQAFQARHPIEGLATLERNIADVEASLAPDEEFFAGVDLAQLQENAVASRLNGHTRPIRDLHTGDQHGRPD